MTGLLALNVVLTVLGVLVLLPIGVFCVECLAAVLRDDVGGDQSRLRSPDDDVRRRPKPSPARPC